MISLYGDDNDQTDEQKGYWQGVIIYSVLLTHT